MKRALEVCRRLCGEAGFSPGFVDDTLLEGAIRRRMLATATIDAGDYFLHLSASPGEQDELLEEFLVRESWFFRDVAPFELVGELVRNRSERLARRPLAVLSAPCAGGEEPYSIAMALAGAGLASAEFCIDAVDLSRRGLALAQQARYGRNAVRHVPPGLATEFLEVSQTGGVEVRAALRGTVRLHRANLLDLPASLRERRFELIFCRNVLIYLDAVAREQLLAQLDAMLAAGGLLVVGHAEPGLLVGRGFEPVGTAGAFAFERRRAVPAPAAIQHRPGPVRAAIPRARLRDPIPAAPSTPPATPAVTASVAEQVKGIQALADAGAYVEAGRRAEDLIGTKPGCADAHYLLGLIRAAEGRGIDARRSFERAAYLDPLHGRALRHLALLLEAAGDRSAATRMLRRAERSGSVAE